MSTQNKNNPKQNREQELEVDLAKVYEIYRTSDSDVMRQSMLKLRLLLGNELVTLRELEVRS